MYVFYPSESQEPSPEMLVKSTGKEKPRPPVGKEQAPPEGVLSSEALRRLRGPPSKGALPPEALRRLRGLLPTTKFYL